MPPINPNDPIDVNSWTEFRQRYFSWVDPTTTKIKNFVIGFFVKIGKFFIDLFSACRGKDGLSEKEIKSIIPPKNKEKINIQKNEGTKEKHDLSLSGSTPQLLIKSEATGVLVEPVKEIFEFISNRLIENYIPNKNVEKSLSGIGSDLGRAAGVQAEEILLETNVPKMFTEVMEHLHFHANTVYQMEGLNPENEREKQLLIQHKLFIKNENSTKKVDTEKEKILNKNEKKYQKVFQKKRREFFLKQSELLSKNKEIIQGQQIRNDLKEKKTKLKIRKHESEKKKNLSNIGEESLKETLINKELEKFKEKLEKISSDLRNKKFDLNKENESIAKEEKQLNLVSQLNQKMLDELVDQAVLLVFPDIDWERIVNDEEPKEEILNEIEKYGANNWLQMVLNNKDSELKAPEKLLDALRKIMKALPEISEGFGPLVQQLLKWVLGPQIKPEDRKKGMMLLLKMLIKNLIEPKIMELNGKNLQEFLSSSLMPLIEENLLFMMVKHELRAPEQIKKLKEICNNKNVENKNFDNLWNSICENLSKDYLNKDYKLEDCQIQDNKNLRDMFNLEINAIIKIFQEKNNTKSFEDVFAEYYKEPENVKEKKTVIGNLVETLVSKLGNYGYGTSTILYWTKTKNIISQVASNYLVDYEKPEFFLEKMNIRLRDPEAMKKTINLLIPSSKVNGKENVDLNEKEEKLEIHQENKKDRPLFEKISKIGYALLKQKTAKVSDNTFLNWGVSFAVKKLVPKTEDIKKLITNIFEKLFSVDDTDEKSLTPETQNLLCSLGIIVLKNLNEAKDNIKNKECIRKILVTDEQTPPQKTEELLVIQENK